MLHLNKDKLELKLQAAMNGPSQSTRVGCATYMYSGQDPLHVWAVWSIWQIVCGSYTELMVLWWSIKMEHATRCNVGEHFWQVLSTNATCNVWRKSVGKSSRGDIHHFVFWAKCTGRCYLITWVLFGISKFLSGESTDAVCKSLAQIGEIAWEEYGKVRLRRFADLRKKW